MSQLAAWWAGGDILMPVMFVVAVVLYSILAERSLVLWGVRRRQRGDELLALLASGPAHGRWRAWAARYIGLAEAEHLARGFALSRALTACLPLLGLFGTVTGMVDTFSQLGGTMAQQASAGIGLALTATQYGMALAIPAVLWDWMLARRAAQLVLHRELLMRSESAP